MLRAGRWLDVFQGIAGLPQSIQNEAVWRYWKARALKALNAGYQANQIFARLSQEIHYYGLLAYEELPARLEARPDEYRPTPDQLKAAESHPGLARALLLRKLDRQADAVAEWEWALRGMDDQALLAAAELARAAEWFDRAILTAEKTREEHSFDLRYLTPYRDLAEAQASRNDLDPAWVYGLMRQESRFVDHARSQAGAQGLMQIMPQTAKWIARRLGQDRTAYRKMADPEANIRFGTYYLRHLLDSLDGSPVLATAGYNAGPGRARRWRADTALEGAIYIETIPYAETREYVKKVLANAMYYNHRLGLPSHSLKERLGTIPAKPASATVEVEAEPVA
jgi:soluble lytic murein transglycosylase